MMKETIKNAAILFFVGGFLLTAQVFGQIGGDPENMCRNGAFPREDADFTTAVVKGVRGERVYFYGDEREDCPKNKNCRLKSYVIPNDEVIVSRRFGDFACAWYQPRRGSETVGWLPLVNLDFSATPSISAAEAWVGDWHFYDNSIKIARTAAKNVYRVTGSAIWRGLGDNVHVGELDGEVNLAGGKLLYAEGDDDKYDCRVKMSLVGAFLIVSDNLNCGGANVSFSGVYRKKTGK